jgi:tetratricopeptide (TPR) repeat protein
LYAFAALLLAVPMAAISSVVRPEPAAPPALLPDPRTAGQRAVEDAQRRLAQAPQDTRALTALAGAYLQRARETGDPTYYPKTDGLLTIALAMGPADADTIIIAGSLALARHDFAAAVDWGRRAVDLAPRRPAAYGVLVDALVELGRYDEAIAAAQLMVDLRPDLASYTRVSYLRELHGDLAGAIDAMQLAIQAGPLAGETTAWCEVQLGNLHFATGHLDDAEHAYLRSLRRIDGYPHGNAGLARVRAARGDLAAAAKLYERAVARLPLPDYVGALGDVYARQGNADGAARQYALVEVERQLLVANGVRIDADLAMFYADHRRDLARALEAARVEYTIRPSVHIADVLAWAELQNGDLAGAVGHSEEALRLGSRDPLVLYHAGVIAETNGDRARAYELLRRAHDQNPQFSLLWADDLAGRLSTLGGAGSER